MVCEKETELCFHIIQVQCTWITPRKSVMGECGGNIAKAIQILPHCVVSFHHSDMLQEHSSTANMLAYPVNRLHAWIVIQARSIWWWFNMSSCTILLVSSCNVQNKNTIRKKQECPWVGLSLVSSSIPHRNPVLHEARKHCTFNLIALAEVALFKLTYCNMLQNYGASYVKNAWVVFLFFSPFFMNVTLPQHALIQIQSLMLNCWLAHDSTCSLHWSISL